MRFFECGGPTPSSPAPVPRTFHPNLNGAVKVLGTRPRMTVGAWGNIFIRYLPTDLVVSKLSKLFEVVVNDSALFCTVSG